MALTQKGDHKRAVEPTKELKQAMGKVFERKRGLERIAEDGDSCCMFKRQVTLYKPSPHITLLCRIVSMICSFHIFRHSITPNIISIQFAPKQNYDV